VPCAANMPARRTTARANHHAHVSISSAAVAGEAERCLFAGIDNDHRQALARADFERRERCPGHGSGLSFGLRMCPEQTQLPGRNARAHRCQHIGQKSAGGGGNGRVLACGARRWRGRGCGARFVRISLTFIVLRALWVCFGRVRYDMMCMICMMFERSLKMGGFKLG
jgi:hypothetical protein